MIDVKNDEAESSAKGCQLLTEYDVIFVDACSWMSPEMGPFLQQAEPFMKAVGRRFTVIPSVYRELENCSAQKYAAQTALELIRQYGDLVDVESGEDAATTADRDFVRLFFFQHRKRRQMLITHDQQLSQDIQNCCASEESEAGSPATAVMTLWHTGELIGFSEMFRRKTAQARARLEEMVGNNSVYVDSTALGNANAELFLEHIAEPMQKQGKWVQVLQNSLLPEMDAITAPLLEKHSGLLHVLQIDAALSETDALLGELYLSEANADAEKVVLVTDDVARANELKNRRPKCDRFPFVDFMTINKYGFLSYLRLSDPASAPRFRVPQYASQSITASGFSQEKKPASYVPQLIGAIKSEDIEAMCSFIEKGANLRNGIITSLCQEKNNCLSVLIDRAQEGIDPSCFQWWVISYYSFSDPFYLDENNEHFELLKRLIAKSGAMDGQREAMVQLARLVSLPAAAHDRLWTIIRLAAEKGASLKVYSSSTGETLLDIAKRQNNEDMAEFISARIQSC